MHTFKSKLYDIDKYIKPNNNLWSYQSITLDSLKLLILMNPTHYNVQIDEMHMHMNELFNVHYIILNGVENNNYFG